MKSLVSVLCGVAFVSGCSGGEKKNVPAVISQLPIPEPTWIPFNVPIGQVTLPAFMVGEARQLSTGCWEMATARENTAVDTLKWEREQKNKFELGLQAEFKKALVEANLDASILDQFMQKWTLTGEGLSLLEVDPAIIRPKFTNSACTEADLDWFADGRPVITQAIKAKKVSIKAAMSMSDDQKAKLDAAIEKLGTSLKSSFQKLKEHSGTLEIEAADAYVGGIGTNLKVKRCQNTRPFSVTPNKTFDMCGYSIKLVPSAMPTRYTLAVTPPQGATGEFDQELGKQKTFALGDLRIVNALVEKEGSSYKIQNLRVLLVGAGG